MEFNFEKFLANEKLEKENNFRSFRKFRKAY